MVFLMLVLFLWSILRYVLYQRCIQWRIPDPKKHIEHKYDDMYEEALLKPTQLFADYTQMNIDSFKEGYYTCLLRKYPSSNANDAQLELAEVQDGMHLLDLGCGTGEQAIHYCRRFTNLTVCCVVNVEKLYRTTYENIKKANLLERIQVYCMDMDRLVEPIQSQRFDRIFMIQTVGYSVQRKTLFHHLHSLLKPSGKLLISTLTVSSNDDEHIQQVISLWKYNFSTLESILKDLVGYKVRYISLPKYGTYFFINPIDFYYIYRFNQLNQSDIDLFSFYYTQSMTNQILVADKN